MLTCSLPDRFPKGLGQNSARFLYFWCCLRCFFSAPVAQRLRVLLAAAELEVFHGGANVGVAQVILNWLSHRRREARPDGCRSYASARACGLSLRERRRRGNKAS